MSDFGQIERLDLLAAPSEREQPTCRTSDGLKDSTCVPPRNYRQLRLPSRTRGATVVARGVAKSRPDIERFLAAVGCVNFSFPCRNLAINLKFCKVHIPFGNLNALCHHCTTNKNTDIFQYFILILESEPRTTFLFSLPLEKFSVFTPNSQLLYTETLGFHKVRLPLEASATPSYLIPATGGKVVTVLRRVRGCWEAAKHTASRIESTQEPSCSDSMTHLCTRESAVRDDSKIIRSNRFASDFRQSTTGIGWPSNFIMPSSGSSKTL